MYRVEHKAVALQIVRTKKHSKLRNTDSRAAMQRLHDWLVAQRGLDLPKGPLGKAVSYALANWEHLQVFLDDVQVPVDNNASERALRIVALGPEELSLRRSPAGGQNLAILYSLMATCEAHGIDPHAYLADVLVRIDEHPAKRIDKLLPDQWAVPSNA